MINLTLFKRLTKQYAAMKDDIYSKLKRFKLNRQLTTSIFVGMIVSVTLGVIMLPSAVLAEQPLNGAGSTFVYPLLSKWSYEYEKKTGVKINYQPIGSGGEIGRAHV